MRIAIIEDEYFIADDLAVEIRRGGHESIGPFAELSPAFHREQRGDRRRASCVATRLCTA